MCLAWLFSKGDIMKRRHNENICLRDLQHDESGNAIINMTVNDDSDFLFAFSECGSPVISDDVAAFIESRAEALHPRESITLRIHSDCIDQEKKIVYERAVRDFYVERHIANTRNLRRNVVVASVLAVVGVFVLALSLFLGTLQEGILWSEVIDIVAWVLLWEAVDISLLQSYAMRVRRLRYLSYIHMNIEYYQLKTEKTG